MSDIDILLYPSDRPVDSTANGQEIPDDAQKNTTVVVHISLTTPATAAPPASIASLYVELRSEETIGVSRSWSERIHLAFLVLI